MTRTLTIIAVLATVATWAVFHVEARRDLDCRDPSAVGTEYDRCPETRAHRTHAWACTTDMECMEEDRAWRMSRAARR